MKTTASLPARHLIWGLFWALALVSARYLLIGGDGDVGTTNDTVSAVVADGPTERGTPSIGAEISARGVIESESMDPEPFTWNVAVESDVGLCPPAIDLLDCGDGRLLHTVRVVNGYVTIPAEPQEFVVAAAGHGIARVRPGDARLVLRGDDVLVIEAEGLSSCVASVGLMPYTLSHSKPGVLRKSIVYSFDGANVFRIATATGPLARAGTSSLDAVLRLRNGGRVSITRNLKSNSFDRVALPTWALEEGPSAPLNVRVESVGSLMSGKCDLMMLSNEHYVVSRHDLVWGTVIVYEDERIMQRRSGSGDVLEFGPRRLNRDFVLTVVDERSGSYARKYFRHDGSEQVVRLEPGIEIKGRLVAPHGCRQLGDVTLSWEVDNPENHYDMVTWRGERLALTIDTAGYFRQAIPTRVPMSPRSSFPIEGKLRLSLEVDGFGSTPITLAEPVRGVVDIGTIDLSCIQPDVVLDVPDDGSCGCEDLLGQVLVTPGPAGTRLLRIDAVIELTPGRLGVYLEKEKRSGEPSTRSTAARMVGVTEMYDPENPGLGTQVLLGLNSNGAIAAQRREDGTYVALPVTEYKVDLVDIGHLNSESWYFGIEWRGLDWCGPRISQAGYETGKLGVVAPSTDSVLRIWPSHNPTSIRTSMLTGTQGAISLR